LKISQSFNVQKENLQDAPSWMDKLLQPLNQVFNQVIQALQSNLTLEDNVVGQIRSVTFNTDASYTATNAFNTLIVPWAFPNKKRPQAVIVGQVSQPSNQAVINKPVMVPSWIYDGVSSIRIPYITGLADSSQYTITFVIL
jgi:hypothetical protein